MSTKLTVVYDADTIQDVQTLLSAHPCTVAPAQPVEPNNDEVICPNCVHQFRAIPVNVQRLMLNAGFEPPFTQPAQAQEDARKPLTEEQIESLAEEYWADTIGFARAIEANHGIGTRDAGGPPA